MGGLIQDASRAAELAKLFPDALGEDGVPVGWERQLLGDAYTVKIGRTP
jgi:type I restriction enzyme S subunit